MTIPVNLIYSFAFIPLPDCWLDGMLATLLGTILFFAPQAPDIAHLRTAPEAAQPIIERLKADARGQPLALLLQAQIQLEQFHFEQAVALLEEAGRAQADLPRLQGMRGLAYFKLGRTAEAIACFEHELQRAPQDFPVLYYLAAAHEKQNDLPAARRHIEAALAQQTQSAEALTLYSQVLSKQNQFAPALAALERVFAAQPDAANDAEKRYLRARLYQRLGRKQDAARELAAVQRLKDAARQQEKAKP